MLALQQVADLSKVYSTSYPITAGTGSSPYPREPEVEKNGWMDSHRAYFCEDTKEHGKSSLDFCKWSLGKPNLGDWPTKRKCLQDHSQPQKAGLEEVSESLAKMG